MFIGDYVKTASGLVTTASVCAIPRAFARIKRRPGSRRLRLLEWWRGAQKVMTLAEKNEQKMTNEANILLKTKDRVYKRSQTNPTEFA